MTRPKALLIGRIATRAAAIIAICSATYIIWAADLIEPQRNDRFVTRVVNDLMGKVHLLQMPLDNTIAKRGLKLYIEGLDPLKVYFTKSDVDEFMRSATKVDDQLKQGDLALGYTIYERMLDRIEERVALINRILDGPLDFTRDERMLEPDEYDYAVSAGEIQDRWRIRLKYQLLGLKADEMEQEEAIAKLKRRYSRFQRRMAQTDSDELLEIYLTAFTTAYDPHTTYMSPSSLTNFRIQMRLNLEGIGAALKTNDEGYTVVTKVIPGGAADKHGKLAVDDKIVSVAQATGEFVDIYEMKITDVVKKIRGPAGTIVRLGVIPATGGDKQVYTITRAKVELSDQEAQGEVFEFGQYKIGVIDLPSFYMDMKAARANDPNYRSTTRDVRRILDGFRDQGVHFVVLDLRRNGGGSLTEAIDLTGLFIDRGPVVQVKDIRGRIEAYDDDQPGMAWRGPLIVLTSRFSASASEILAGAIQDYQRGLVIGDSATHGKGTVQSLMELGAELFPRMQTPPNLGALKVTVSKFYRPSGASTQKRGVAADLTLPSLSGVLKGIGEEDLDYCIDWDKVPAVPHVTYRMTSQDVLATLRGNSAARVAKSDKFADVRKIMERYLERKEEKAVTVNEEEYFQRLEELDEAAEEEKLLDDSDEEEDAIVRDYYLDEVFAIGVDYVRQLSRSRTASSSR